MTNPINNANPAPFLQSNRIPLTNDKGVSSYRESLARRSEANISITTDEGDVVTISNFQEYASSQSAEKWTTPLQHGVNFTTSKLSINSFNLSVAGDLNEEELADIAELLKDLSSIAGHFYRGNMDKAMNEALTIGDMGSISQLSASFSYQERWSASQLTEYHPLPASDSLQQKLAENFAGISSIIDEAYTGEMKYAETLQAQWQQIKDFLEARDMESQTGNDAFNSRRENDIPTARHMMHRIKQTMEKHPRLAPLSLPIAHKAIDQEEKNIPFSTMPGQKNMLTDNLLDEFNNWLYEA
ncbi:MAG: hypothetical protein BM485_10125 [Desulfobulbaceae bacterium DB1]|nr:MAG: hypothetical protein BM485_10125 [Desulfobulbaceae bacterium DB1]